MVATFSTSTPSTALPTMTRGVRHPVVGVGLELPAVQRCGRDAQSVVVLVDRRPETAELDGQGGEPVGLVAADVRDAAQT